LSGFGLLAGEFSGSFVLPRVSFIGFAFNGGAGRQYGWVRVKMSGYNSGNGFEVLDYAYGDPGEPIRIGQTSSPTDAPPKQPVPRQGSLGFLALGAVGLALWRQRRQAASL
jgi:MYXO-CTERM domain-containing protein